MRKCLNLILLCSPLFFFASCGQFPKDPGNTLKTVTNGTLRAGIAEAGKWASLENDSAAGIEPELLRKYAQSINAEIEWTPASQDQLIKLLHEDEIDIAIGGFVKKSPFKKEAGWTRPHQTEKIKIGAPAEVPIPQDVEDQKILAKKGSAALLALKKKKGIPIPYDTLPQPFTLIAAPEEELLRHNLQLSDYTLAKIEHVIAIQKGENAFLESLERFIESHGGKK